MIALMCCAFICAITSARCDGEGGIPGFGSRKMSMFNTEAVREVWPRIVIGDDVLAFERQHGGAPFLQLRVDRRLKFLVVRFVKCGVRRIERGKRLRDMLRDRLGDDRIDSEMRIAKRMHVARGARDVRRHVHETDALRRLHASRFADLDLRVPRVLQKRRQPAELELCAAVDQHIGVAQ